MIAIRLCLQGGINPDMECTGVNKKHMSDVKASIRLLFCYKSTVQAFKTKFSGNF